MLPGMFIPPTLTPYENVVISFTLNAANGTSSKVGYEEGNYGSISSVVGSPVPTEFISRDTEPDVLNVSFTGDVRSTCDGLKVYADGNLIATLGSGFFFFGATGYTPVTTQLFTNGVSYEIELRE